MAQLTIAIIGNNSAQLGQCDKANANKIEDKAPATPNILWLLEANIEAIIQAHIPVISHCKGVAQLATAKDIDNGIFIIATVNQAFQFDFIFSMMLSFIIVYLIDKYICFLK